MKAIVSMLTGIMLLLAGIFLLLVGAGGAAVLFAIVGAIVFVFGALEGRYGGNNVNKAVPGYYSTPKKTCPKCGEKHDINFPKCPYCGYDPDEETQEKI